MRLLIPLLIVFYITTVICEDELLSTTLPPICEGACGSTNTITAVSPPGGTKQFARDLMDVIAKGSKTTMTASKPDDLQDQAVDALTKELQHLIAKKQAIRVARTHNGNKIKRFLKASEEAHKTQIKLAKKQPHSRRSQLVSVHTVSERRFKRTSYFGSKHNHHHHHRRNKLKHKAERAKKKFAKVKRKMRTKMQQLKQDKRTVARKGGNLLKKAYHKTKSAMKKAKLKAKQLASKLFGRRRRKRKHYYR